MHPSYDPSVFDTASLKQAKAIILTPEGLGTEARWEKETPWLVDLALRELPITKGSVVLDYGCGVGRLAKELIARTGCWVHGVDTSPSMRAIAPRYVDSKKFSVGSPTDPAPAADVILAVWVLQHCLEPKEDLEFIEDNSYRNARMLLVNNVFRAVPVRTKGQRWFDDGLNLEELLLKNFVERSYGTLPEEFAPRPIGNTFWACYEKVS